MYKFVNLDFFFLTFSITQTFQKKRERRNSLPVQDTDFATFLQILLKISGKLDFLPPKLVWKEVCTEKAYKALLRADFSFFA